MMPFAHSPLSSYAPLGCGDYNLTNFSPPGPTPPINSGRDPVNKPIPPPLSKGFAPQHPQKGEEEEGGEE
jgi:hypothetical protein